MKNDDLQNLKPVYIHETNFCADDEISLLDLTVILVQRKKMILLITTFIIVAGIIAALMMPRLYTYSTSIEIGSQLISDNIKPFESPQTLLAKVQNVFIPQALNKQRQAHPKDKEKYQITAGIPVNSEIITLEVKNTEGKSDVMSNLLHEITQLAILDHNHIYNSIKQNITSQLAQATNELEALRESNDKAELVRQQIVIETYHSQLANLRMTRELLTPIKSLEPTGTSRKSIVSIAVFLGLFIAVAAAFSTELASKIKEKIKSD